MLPAETVELIQKTAVDAAGVEIKELPGESRRVLIAAAGSYTLHDIPAPLRLHKINTLEDLTKEAEDAATAAVGRVGPALWYEHAAVVLTYDYDDRRDRATLTLIESEQFKTLKALQTIRALNQAAFCRLLKHDLAGAIPDTLLPTIRRLTFTKNAGGNSDLQHGRDTMGRQVEAAVVGAIDIPEYLTAAVPIYANPGLTKRHEIRLSLEISTTTEEFILRPLPDACQNAVDAAQAWIGNALRDLAPESCSVINGRP